MQRYAQLNKQGPYVVGALSSAYKRQFLTMVFSVRKLSIFSNAWKGWGEISQLDIVVKTNSVKTDQEENRISGYLNGDGNRCKNSDIIMALFWCNICIIKNLVKSIELSAALRLVGLLVV